MSTYMTLRFRLPLGFGFLRTSNEWLELQDIQDN